MKDFEQNLYRKETPPPSGEGLVWLGSQAVIGKSGLWEEGYKSPVQLF